ncbi:unnamed protein product, partial [Brachionus calyciflorus]
NNQAEENQNDKSNESQNMEITETEAQPTESAPIIPDKDDSRKYTIPNYRMFQ